MKALSLLTLTLALLISANSFASSSAEKREENSLDLQFNPIGFVPSPSMSLSLGVHLQPDQVLYFQHGGASAFLGDMEETYNTLGLKTFWGNSFYTKLGYSQRSYSFDWRMDRVDNSFESVTRNASARGVEFALGNQWQFGAFTLGVDWIGAYIPLSTEGDEAFKEGTYNSYDVSSANEDLDFVKSVQTSFTRLSVGLAF